MFNPLIRTRLAKATNKIPIGQTNRALVVLMLVACVKCGAGVATTMAATSTNATLRLVLQADPVFDPVLPSIVGHGDFITYTLTLTNNSDIIQTQVVLSDSVPAGTSLVASSMHPVPASAPASPSPAVAWVLPALNPGEVFTAYYTVRVSNYVTVTAIINKASASSAETVPMQSNTTVHPFDVAKNPPVRYIYYFPLFARE